MNIDLLSKPIVISYENDVSNNINAKIFKKTLDKNKWEYLFIGDGKTWSGFKDKIVGFYEALKSLPSNKIVVLSDSRDVFCLRNTDFFIEKIKHIIDEQIIISAEMFLLGHMNWSKKQISDAISKQSDYFWQGEPLDNYWKFYNKDKNIPIRKYINTGLIIGRCSKLVNMFKWVIDNNYDDDQLGLSRFTNEFPQLIYLDYEAKFLHTSTFGVDGSLYNHEIQKNDAPSFSELLGLSTYFLHVPGISISIGQKHIYNILYKIFDNDIIVKDMFQIYNFKSNIENKNIYFQSNDK